VPCATTTPDTPGSASTSATASVISSHCGGPNVAESASRTDRAETRTDPGRTDLSSASIVSVAGSESPAVTTPSALVDATIVPPVVQITTWGVSVLVSAVFTRSTVASAGAVVNRPGREVWNNGPSAFVGPVSRPEHHDERTHA